MVGRREVKELVFKLRDLTLVGEFMVFISISAIVSVEVAFSSSVPILLCDILNDVPVFRLGDPASSSNSWH